MITDGLQFNIYGSKSSTDYDVMVFVSSIGTIEYSHKMIKKINTELTQLFAKLGMPPKKVNANIGVVVDGMMTRVFKGTPDECNNSLFFTYHNHSQIHQQVVRFPYDRFDIDYKHLKLKRCYRFLLSFYSRTKIRAEIKDALRGNFLQRLAVLQCIDFNLPEFKDFPGKKESHDDIYKVIAFQLAQTISLMRGFQLYTKEEVIEDYPDLTPYIMREKVEDHSALNKYLEILIDIGIENAPLMLNLDEEKFN